MKTHDQQWPGQNDYAKSLGLKETKAQTSQRDTPNDWKEFHRRGRAFNLGRKHKQLGKPAQRSSDPHYMSGYNYSYKSPFK